MRELNKLAVCLQLRFSSAPHFLKSFPSQLNGTERCPARQLGDAEEYPRHAIDGLCGSDRDAARTDHFLLTICRPTFCCPKPEEVSWMVSRGLIVYRYDRKILIQPKTTQKWLWRPLYY